MRVVILICVLFCYASAGLARDLTVRSGEHEGFTRLAIDVPPKTGWQLETYPRGTRLWVTLAGAEKPVFKTENVFRKIRRTRISEVNTVPGTGTLDISFACDCAVSAFETTDNMIVLDIAEVSDTEDPPTGRQASAHQRMTHPFTIIRLGQDPGLGPVLEKGVENATSFQAGQGQSLAAGEAYQSLSNQVRQGAIAGLLDAQTNIHPAHQIPSKSRKQEEINTTALGPDTNANSLRLNQGSRFTSASGVDCYPGDRLAIWTWSDESAAAAQLGQLRSRLFLEFDEPDSAAAIDYVKLLITFGMGAEAQSALRSLKLTDQPELEVLARLVDGDLGPFTIFDQHMHCDSPAAFWSILSAPKTSLNEPANHRAILQTYELLPEPLKSQLGANLIDRLISLEMPELAQEILQRYARIAGSESTAVRQFETTLALMTDQIDLTRRIERGPNHNIEPQTPESVIAAIDVAQKTGASVAEDTLTLAEAFSREYEGHDLSEPLSNSVFKALILNAKYRDALTYAQKNGDETGQLENTVYSAVVSQASDSDFLTVFLNVSDRDIEKIEKKTRINTARKFLELGFPDITLRYLKFKPSSDSKTIAHLRASALLALNRAEEAELLLLPFNDETSEKLRTEARTQMGDHQFGLREAERTGKAQSGLESAWIAGDWDRVIAFSKGLEDQVLSETVQAIQRSTSTDNLNYPDDTLASYEHLVNESVSSRNTLKSLLTKTRVGK